jgi:hypothetical protein
MCYCKIGEGCDVYVTHPHAVMRGQEAIGEYYLVQTRNEFKYFTSLVDVYSYLIDIQDEGIRVPRTVMAKISKDLDKQFREHA